MASQRKRGPMALRHWLLPALPFSPSVGVETIYAALNCGFYVAWEWFRTER
jgi:hypothetical protein